ncbi:MAG: hypothetical protein HN909_03930 [Phycisphaerales bacterium]|jgi:hypothetical protein|nr:hypothetical protein [Phycisphaerales bacterium]MBT7170902.1 hypothetical protein [Phycisphaerales bacterium]
MKKITANSVVPFGAYGAKGKKLSLQTDTFLNWMVRTLMESDKCAWAHAAKEELARRKKGKGKGTISTQGDLDTAAADFLKKHGINPKQYE